MGSIRGPQLKRPSDEPQPPRFTVGFVIFSIIVVVWLSFLGAIFEPSQAVKFTVAIIVGWNLRKFYFGPWQKLQTRALISLNNWLKKGKD